MKISSIKAREILDSRGKPTIAASCELTDGSIAEASVPSGASTGTEEAHELRDGDKKRYGGDGVLKAVSNVNDLIAPEILGFDARDQVKIDKKLCRIDGTPNKSYLGANAILAVSLAVAKAQALSDKLELFEYLAVKYRGAHGKNYKLPTPMFNILNGGKHADNNVDIQETMIVPTGPKSFAAKLRAGAEVYQTLRNELLLEGFPVGLGDEGGFAPNFKSNEETFRYIKKAIKETNYSLKSIRISTDIAADSFYSEKSKTYTLNGEGKNLDSGRMILLISRWVKNYDLLSVEDGLFEKDPNWAKLTASIKPSYSIGDDLLVTNSDKIQKAAKNKEANGVIIKANQIGTVTETLGAIKVAQKNKFKVIVSHRSGETSDSFIADLAVATGADFIKSGAPARSERLAKYNRLLKIEEMLS
jgi:enolase